MPSFSPLRALCALTVGLLVAFAATAPDSSARRAAARAGPECGGPLWRLMTLSDPQRMLVDLHGVQTTIADIASRPSPKRVVPSRATAFQRRVWRLRAVVDRYRIASNGEIVLVLYSIDTGQFMDAYLPAKQCLGRRARDRTGMLAARREFTSRCPTVSWQWQLLGVTVDIGGVGFWNPVRTTRGALRNGAELRPVTNLKVVSGCGVG